MTNPTPSPGAKVGRARRQLSQLWQVPTFLFGVLAFLGVAASTPWRHSPDWYKYDARLRDIRSTLKKNEPDDSITAKTDAILIDLQRYPDRAAEANFLIGSAFYRQARTQPGIIAQELWSRAAAHLEKANDASVPDADRAALKYRLGYCLYQQNKDIPRAIELMTLGVDKGAEQPSEGHRLLRDANLALKPANIEMALAASQRILDLTPEREIDAVAQARLQHVELLLRKPARAEAIKVLERIGPKVAANLRVQARLLQARACEDDGQWQKAVAIWQALANDAAHVEGGRARVYYAIGWCNHQMEPPDNAGSIRAWSEALKLGGPYGQAAGLHLGELRLSMGVANADQALADWKQALAPVRSSKDYANPHVPAADVIKLFDQAFVLFQEKQDPDKAQQVAELYRKIAPGGVADLKLARAAEELAEQMREKLISMAGNVTAEAVRLQFRRAGEAYDHAANAVTAERRAELLWRSVQCFLAAKENALAQKNLVEHLKAEKNELRLAEAYFTLGDLCRAQKETIPARDAFIKCIEIPDTPFASRARYFLALDEIDKKAYDKALVILKQNLQDDSPSFDRPAHEKSLYKMAWVLLQLGKYEEAVVYLKEAPRIYPANHNALLAREQLGDAYRKLAEKVLYEERELLKRSETPGLSDEQRQSLHESAISHRKARIGWLTAAVKTFQEMADELTQQALQKPLNPGEQELYRRAWFGIGECHLDNEELGEALRIFAQVQAKHRRTLESCYACLRVTKIASVMQVRQFPEKQVQDAHQQAKASLDMMAEDLKAMPADAEAFRRPNAPTRQEWLQWHETALQHLISAAQKN